jgi:hypothetical protein
MYSVKRSSVPPRVQFFPSYPIPEKEAKFPKLTNQHLKDMETLTAPEVLEARRKTEKQVPVGREPS